MGVHVTWNVLKTTRAETINTLSGCLIKSFIVKVTCSIVDAQVRLVFPRQSRHESIRACCTRFLLVRWVVLLHLYSSYFPFIKQQDLIWVLEYQRWSVTSSHLVGNLCVALGLSILKLQWNSKFSNISFQKNPSKVQSFVTANFKWAVELTFTYRGDLYKRPKPPTVQCEATLTKYFFDWPYQDCIDHSLTGITDV